MLKNKKMLIITIASLLVLSAASLFTYDVVQSQTINQLMEEGKLELEQKNYEKCVEIFLDVLGKEEGHVDARLALATCYYELGEWDLFEEVLYQGIYLDHTVADYYTMLSDFYLEELLIADAAKVNKQGFDATREPIFSENLEYIEENLRIVLEYPVVQTGYKTSVNVVWLDKHLLPLDLEWKVGERDVGQVYKDEAGKTFFHALEEGETELSTQVGAVTLKTEVEVREKALKEIEIEAVGLGDEKIVGLGNEVTLTASGVDFSGEVIQFEPEWQLTNELGTLSSDSGRTVTFFAEESGLEIITATFEHVEAEFQLIVDDGKNKSILYEVEGEGTVVFSPAEASYEVGTVVTVEAVPEPGWQFVRWEGDLDGTENPVEVVMDEHKSIVAVFEPAVYHLSVNVVGDGRYAVNTLQDSYKAGDVVTLTAMPNAGSYFVRWEGDVYSRSETIRVVMTDDMELTVVFAREGARVDGSNVGPYVPPRSENDDSVRGNSSDGDRGESSSRDGLDGGSGKKKDSGKGKGTGKSTNDGGSKKGTGSSSNKGSGSNSSGGNSGGSSGGSNSGNRGNDGNNHSGDGQGENQSPSPGTGDGNNNDQGGYENNENEM